MTTTSAPRRAAAAALGGYLRDAGLVTARREGTWMHYRIDPQLATWANESLRQVFCQLESLQPFLAETRIDQQVAKVLRSARIAAEPRNGMTFLAETDIRGQAEHRVIL